VKTRGKKKTTILAEGQVTRPIKVKTKGYVSNLKKNLRYTPEKDGHERSVTNQRGAKRRLEKGMTVMLGGEKNPPTTKEGQSSARSRRGELKAMRKPDRKKEKELRARGEEA